MGNYGQGSVDTDDGKTVSLAVAIYRTLHPQAQPPPAQDASGDDGGKTVVPTGPVLPPGWEALKSRSTGQDYFWHDESKTSTYDYQEVTAFAAARGEKVSPNALHPLPSAPPPARNNM